MNISAKALIIYALPTMIANVFMSLYSTVDGVFVSNIVGTDALSAVNIVMPYVMVVLAFGIMTGTGGSALVSAQMGEGKGREARENFSFLCCTCFVFCCVIAVLSFAFRRPLLVLLGANDAVFGYCMRYATPLFFFAPFAFLGMAIQSFFIAAGKPLPGMAFSVAGGAVNIFLDWLLIAKLGMDLQGAALATGIGYSVPGVLGLVYFAVCRKGTLYFVRPRFSISVLLKTAVNGSSEMVAVMASGITTVMMNNIVMKLVGEDGVAAISILVYTMSLLTSVYMGYSMGVAPLTSYNHGAGNTANLKKANKINLIFIAVLGVSMYVLGLLLKNPMISVFAVKGSEVYSMATEGYTVFLLSYLYMGFNMYSSSFFTALGDGKTSAVISFCRGLVFLSLTLYIMSALFGLHGLWAAMPVAELMGLALSIYFMIKRKPCA